MGHIATLTQAFMSGQSGEAGGSGALGGVGQAVVGLGKKGKEKDP